MAEVKARFTIQGKSLELEKLTQSVGIQPTSSWKTGDPIPRTFGKRKTDGWSISTSYVETFDAAEVLDQLLQKLMPTKEKLLKFCAKNKVETELSLAILALEGDVPSINLDPNCLASLNSLHCSLDVDVITGSREN